MGGPGSGNYSHGNRPAKKPLVEDCRRLDVSFLHRNESLGTNTTESPTVTFWDTFVIGVATATIADGGGVLRMDYCTVHKPPSIVKDVIGLTTTRPRFGGVRWWFRCPGAECGRRVGALYLPTGGVHFRCRVCHGLTYRKQQNGHRDRALLGTELGQALRPLIADADAAIADARRKQREASRNSARRRSRPPRSSTGTPNGRS